MFNNGYAGYGGYGNYNYNYGQSSQPVQTQQMSFVNGIEGAKGYVVPPNTTMFLMDSDSEQFFIKTADRNGMCNIRVYEFKEKAMDKPAPATIVDTSAFVTREEFNNLSANVEALLNKANAANEPIKKTLL